MKKQLACMAFALVLTAGCADSAMFEPRMFGMPESQFRQLPKDQQSEVIASYNRRQEIKAQNEPLDNAVNTLGFLGTLNSK